MDFGPFYTDTLKPSSVHITRFDFDILGIGLLQFIEEAVKGLCVSIDVASSILLIALFRCVLIADHHFISSDLHTDITVEIRT